MRRYGWQYAANCGCLILVYDVSPRASIGSLMTTSQSAGPSSSTDACCLASTVIIRRRSHGRTSTSQRISCPTLLLLDRHPAYTVETGMMLLVREHIPRECCGTVI